MRAISSLLPTIDTKDVLFFIRHLFDGSIFQEQAKKQLSAYFPNSEILLFASGRDALSFLAQHGLKGGKIYLQAFTCSAVIQPFITNGVLPVYVDTDDNFNMDPTSLMKCYTKQARALLMQYTFGLLPKNLNAILSFAKRYKLIVIEDISHAFGIEQNGTYLGNYGAISIVSFGRDKVVSTVGGGALIIHDKNLQSKLRRAYDRLPQQPIHRIALNMLYLVYMLTAKQIYQWKITRTSIYLLQKIGLLEKAVSEKEKNGQQTPGPYRFPTIFAPLLYHQLSRMEELKIKRTETVVLYNTLYNTKYTGSLLKYPLLVKDPNGTVTALRKQQIYLDRWYHHVIDPEGVNLKSFNYVAGTAPNAEYQAQHIINLPTLTPAIVPNNTASFTVREVQNRNEWETFLHNTQWTPFFQSWDFGESTHDSIRLGLYDKRNKLQMGAQIRTVSAKRGNFLHIRHGPIYQSFSINAYWILLNHLIHLGKQKNAVWIRISPLVKECHPAHIVLKQFGFIPTPVHSQDAEDCLVVNLEPPIEKIFSTFRKTTRSSIKKAEKMKVYIEKTCDQKKLSIFFNLYQKTALRQNFLPHQSIKDEFIHMKKSNSIELFIAWYEQKPLAASLIVYCGKQAVYHHSGSERTAIPVNYLLQWEAIKEAKKRGMLWYNLWGIAPQNSKNHPWDGLSLFKRGFGDTELHFMHAHDLPLSLLYWPSYAYQKLWNQLRGY